MIGGMDGIEVEGYDPSDLYERYAKCVRAVNGGVMGSSSGAIWKDWRRLTPEQQAGYGKGTRKGADAFNNYFARRVCAEMDTRDREWMWSGRPCFRTKEPGAKPLKKERDVGTALLMHGFDVDFIKEVNRTRIKTPDALLNKVPWEFKIPEAWNGEHTIRKQFFKALGKGVSRLLISATMNGAPMEDMRKWVLTTFKKGDYEEITEVLLLSSDGERLERLHRWQKGRPDTGALNPGRNRPLNLSYQIRVIKTALSGAWWKNVRSIISASELIRQAREVMAGG